MKKIALIIAVFNFNRIQRFVESLCSKNAGVEFDCYFVHNKHYYPDDKNNIHKSDEEREAITRLLIDLCNLYPNFHYIDRLNRGADYGCYWAGYQHTKDQYEYYFFINEIVVFKVNNWLKVFVDKLDNTPDIGVIGPQICSGMDGRHNTKWCIRGTFFMARNDVLNKIVWKEPTTYLDTPETSAGWQEMCLFYPQLGPIGYRMYQLGNGNEYMNYYFDNNSEWQHSNPQGYYD